MQWRIDDRSPSAEGQRSESIQMPELELSLMGQLLRVVTVTRIADNALRIEVDRSLTGMGLEVFSQLQKPSGNSTSERLAGRVLACDAVSEVSVFSNTVTITFEHEVAVLPDDVQSAVEDLFTHYLPGVELTPITASTN